MNHLYHQHKLTLIILFLGLIFVLSGGGTAVIHAADPILVACTDGVGDVTALIAAFNTANSDPDESTISLGENCTYTLLAAVPGVEAGLPGLEGDLILEGNGATIERDLQAPPFHLLEVHNTAHLAANNLTLRLGQAPTGQGGAIYTMPGTRLTLNQVHLEGNSAKQGGAIYTQGETIIRDSRFEFSTAPEKGGGIYATAALTVERSVLYRGQAQGGGGAIYAASDTTVRDSRFVENGVGGNSGAGGAILADDVLTVTGSHFIFNGARSGGGIFGRDVQITDSIFYRNSANDHGGGVFAIDASRGIHGVYFDQNFTRNYSGGGLYVRADVDLQRSYFFRNEANGVGGGLYLVGYGTSSLIANNLWVGNVSQAKVGNVMSVEVTAGGTVNVRHNTAVYATPAFQPGSGVTIGNGNGVFENNILNGFEVALKDMSGTAVSRSNLYYNNAVNEQGLPAPGENSLVADPRFVDPLYVNPYNLRVGTANYRLGEGSPAIDSAAATDTPADIIGTTRLQGNAPDRGAYEFNGETEGVFPVACAGGVEALAAAITATNLHFGPDVIEIEDTGNEGCLFELTTATALFGKYDQTGLPTVLDTLRIDGGGATLQRNQSAAPFRILDAHAPRLTVENLTIRNGDVENAGGGAIRALSETELHLIGVSLENNQAYNSGGGVYTVGRLSVENSQFTGNQSDSNGGGIYAGDEIDLRASTFSNNRADNDGGGLYLLDPQPPPGTRATNVENNVWLNNQAGRGAAVAIHDKHTNKHYIRHNTIVGDKAPEIPAIHLLTTENGDSSFFVENNIIVAHAVGVRRDNQGYLYTNANLYFDNAVNEFGTNGGGNHVKADPLFRNLTGNDVRLLVGSPAIDSAADLDVDIDRNGVERPQGNGYDIGAYEYVENAAPTATTDNYTTIQNTPLEIPAPGVLGNDEDEDGDLLAAVLESQPAHGEVTLNADGSFSYTPDAGYNGNDSFTYLADDYAEQTEAATVTIEVLPAGSNLPPTAAADAYATQQDKALAIPAPGVLDNDQDANGDALAAVLQSQPANGTVALNADGSFTYTPKAGYTGSDSFSYRAADGEASSTAAVVALSVLPTGANLPPLAFRDSYEATQGQTLTIAAPGVLSNDQDGEALAAVLESEPAHGLLELKVDGSFTYIPDPGFKGQDSFTYRADDGQARSAPAAVTIVVRPQGGQTHHLLLPVVLKP